MGNRLADMQVLLSEMQKSCSRCKVFASRAAKPACQPTIFTGRPAGFACGAAKPECRTTVFTSRPDRLLFYDFTISFPLGSRQEVFACRAAKPECQTTISLVGRPFLHVGPQNLNVGPPFSPVGQTVYYFTILLFYFHWVPGRRFLHVGPQNLNVGPPFHWSAGRFCMSGRKT